MTPGFAFKSASFVAEGIPVVKIANIRDDYTVDLGDVQYWPPDLFSERLQKFVLKDKDILVAMTGATAGKLGRVRTSQHLLLNQRVAKIEAINADPDFVWFALSSEKYREWFYSIAGGAAQPNMSGGQIEAVEIPLPPFGVQRRIAEVLSAYDELIENNRRRMRLLEEAARLLYCEWFVRFRFPGHEHTRILDGIPEGWERKTLGDLVEVHSGFPFKSSTFQELGLHGVVTIGNVQDGEFLPPQVFIDDPPEKMNKECRLETGDILLSLTGFIGRCSFVVGEKYLLNQRVAKLVPVLPQTRAFVYLSFRSEMLQKQLIAISYGVAQQNLSPVKMLGLPVVIPSKTLLREFSQIPESMTDQMLLLKLQNQKLRAARDLLLPRLMSREIAVLTEKG